LPKRFKIGSISIIVQVNQKDFTSCLRWLLKEHFPNKPFLTVKEHEELNPKAVMKIKGK
jgi:type III secretory pathway lipoprotein EscJ